MKEIIEKEIDGKMMLFCQRCQEEKEARIYPSGQHLRADCLTCGRYIKFINQEIPIEEATMPFGKCKGQKLVDILKNDRPYMEWLRENLQQKNKIWEMINQLLIQEDNK